VGSQQRRLCSSKVPQGPGTGGGNIYIKALNVIRRGYMCYLLCCVRSG
jgi:hypothetical protein